MLCCIFLHVAPAQARLRGDVAEYGETTADLERPARPTRDDHTLVPRTTIDSVRYVDHTSRLPAQLCLRFGVSARLIPDAGTPAPDQLIVVVTHPRITRPDQASSTEDSFPTPVANNEVYAGWTFDHPWEQQPGPWVIAFTHEGRVVASKTFTISAPTPGGSRCPPTPIS